MQDVQRHVELWFVGGWRSDQLALGVSGDDGAVCQGESVQRAERMAVPQHCTEIKTKKKIIRGLRLRQNLRLKNGFPKKS